MSDSIQPPSGSAANQPISDKSESAPDEPANSAADYKPQTGLGNANIHAGKKSIKDRFKVKQVDTEQTQTVQNKEDRNEQPPSADH